MRPLEGVTVVSIEQAVAAPFCATRLADAGATVIKVERPEGDFARAYDANIKGQSSYFIWLNRGKKSVVIDLASEEGRKQLETLIAGADVLLQNLKPGAIEKLGFARERLRKDYPALIMCSISGYGDTGPYAQRKAYDLLIQAESGLCSVTGSPDEMTRVGISVVDISTGATAHAAILEALFARSRTGQGADIRVSMFDVMADWMSVPLLNTEAGKPPPRMGLSHPSIAPYGAFRSKDGKDILISIQSEREWKVFCAIVMADAALADDPRFCNMVARVNNREATDKVVGERVRVADARSADRPAGQGRDRLRRGQLGAGSGLASASAPHRDRHARRTRRHAGAGGDLRRREPLLRRRAAGRLGYGRHPQADRQQVMSATAAIDLDHLRTWIGKVEEASDVVTANAVKGMRATLFLDPGEPKTGDAAPVTMHWCYMLQIVRPSEIGPDGHPARGGFLPPVPLPRRMWAGGQTEVVDLLRVGDAVTRRSEIANVELKSGGTGPLCFVTVNHTYSIAARRGDQGSPEHRLSRSAARRRQGGSASPARAEGAAFAGADRGPGDAVPLLGADLQRPSHPLRPPVRDRRRRLPRPDRARSAAGGAADRICDRAARRQTAEELHASRRQSAVRRRFRRQRAADRERF